MEKYYYYMECKECNRHWEVMRLEKVDTCSRCKKVTNQKKRLY